MQQCSWYHHYACGCEIKDVINRLEQNANQLIPWFPENYMKLLNEVKCHLIIFGANKERVDVCIGDTKIKESGEE